MRLGLLIALALILPARAGRIDECLGGYSQSGRTLEADYRFVQDLVDATELENEYIGAAMPVSGSRWEGRNRDRGDRRFRGKAAEERDLQRRFALARAEVDSAPDDLQAHRRLAHLTVEILERTGVPAEAELDEEGKKYRVVVTPVTPAKWREWTKAHSGQEDPGEPPLLTKLAARAARRHRWLTFTSTDLAKYRAGHYSTGSDVSLGLPELFEFRRGTTLQHEDSHDEHFSRSQEPWSENKAFSPGGTRAWLPYVDMELGGKPGFLKDTPYEKSFKLEEIECCLREATQRYQSALRLQAIAARGGHPDAEAQMKSAVEGARDRLDWVTKFTTESNAVLWNGIVQSAFEGPGSKVKHATWSRDGIHVKLDDGYALTLVPEQFPDLANLSLATGRPSLEARLKEIRRVVLQLESDAAALKASLRKRFP